MWKKELPTEIGFYWAKYEDITPQVVRVWRDSRDMLRAGESSQSPLLKHFAEDYGSVLGWQQVEPPKE